MENLEGKTVHCVLEFVQVCIYTKFKGSFFFVFVCKTYTTGQSTELMTQMNVILLLD